MKYLLFALTLFLNVIFISASYAEQRPLTRSLVVTFLDVSGKIGELGQKYPELTNYHGGLSSGNQFELIQFLESSNAYPEIYKLLKASDYSSLEELFGISDRILAIAYFNKMNQPDSVTIFQTEKLLQANLNTLTINQASKNIIVKAKQALEDIQVQAKVIQQTLDGISEQDKIFLLENEHWLHRKFDG